MSLNTVESKTEAVSNSNQKNGEYLSFVLDGESYVIDILKVQEIRGYEAVTKIANTPEYIKGVVNLRGSIVPIVDMRIKFGINAVEYNDLTVVIILNLNGRVVGMVVDGVSEVMEFSAEQINNVPDTVSSVDTQFIDGLISIDDSMFILIDIEQLMSSPEIAQIDTSSLH